MAGRHLLGLYLSTLILSGCSIFPSEFNLSPIYRHRLDPQGRLASMDLLWPLVHYEARPDGSRDFRLRPLYRRVSAPEQELHQFLWPLGRARVAGEEKSLRLLPLFSWRAHVNERGMTDTDWMFLPPIFWGGRGDGENYFACLPLYGRIPDFLSYDEAGWFLFPLYTWSVKGDQRTRTLLFPLLSRGWSESGQGSDYLRVLPFWVQSQARDDFRHRSLLWPLINWGEENLAGRDPRSYWTIFPLYGRKSSRSGDFSDWTALWPFFTCRRDDPESVTWDGPWPLFHYQDTRPSKLDEARFRQWWLLPLYGATDSERHWARTILWPLIRLRRFKEPHVEEEHTALLPLYWRDVTRRSDGTSSTITRIFPLWTTATDTPGRREVRIPDPIPTRLLTGAGWRENYDFLWNLYTRRREGDRVAVTTPANLFCYDRIGGTTTWSLPFLGHHEIDGQGRHTVRLLHLIPISWGGDDPARNQVEGR